jgi:hypothetical protein
MSSFCLIASAAIIIILAGLLGGAINLLQARRENEPTPKHWLYFFLLSIAAAYTVPLFLSLTKSSLLENVLTSPIKAGDWFILFAVCLIAAIYARGFLESVSNKMLRETEDAKREAKKATETADEAKREAKEVAATQEDRERAEEKLENPSSAQSPKTMGAPATNIDLSSFDGEEQKVINAMMRSHYSRRGIGGIATDAGLSRQATRDILKKLVDAGVIVEVLGQRTGNVYYQLRLGNIDSTQSPVNDKT